MSTQGEVRHDAVPRLIAVLQDRSATPARLFEAAGALAEEGSEEALTALADLVGSPLFDRHWDDASLSWYAKSAMVRLGDAGLDRALHALGSRSQPARVAAAEALAELAGPEAEWALRERLADDAEDGTVRRVAAAALAANIDRDLVPALRDVAENGVRDARAVADAALARIDADEGGPQN